MSNDVLICFKLVFTMYLNRPPRATLTQLRTFEAVARLGGITRAAETLHLAQPTVSTQLRELADAVGTALLVPAGRGVKLTDTGRALHETAKAIFAQWNTFEENAADLRGLKRGLLRIAGVSTTEYFLANMLKAFAKKFPLIEIDLAVENRQAVIDRMQREDDDLAVMMLPPAHMPLARFPFMQNPLVVVSALDHPWVSKRRIELSMLVKESLLTREAGSGTRLATETFFESQGYALTPRMTLGSNEAVKHAAAAGLGLAIVSRHALSKSPGNDGLAILRVAGFPLKRSWQLVWRSDRKMSLTASAFIEFVKSQMGRVGFASRS